MKTKISRVSIDDDAITISRLASIDNGLEFAPEQFYDVPRQYPATPRNVVRANNMLNKLAYCKTCSINWCSCKLPF